MSCPRCGSEQISYLGNTVSKNRSAGSWLGWLLIGFFTFGIGWIFLLIMAITNKKTVTNTRAICHKCSHQWNV